MKIITIAVPEEEILALDAFLQQSGILVLDEKDDQQEVVVYELEMEEFGTTDAAALAAMEQMERELEEEIWKLHHFAE